MTDRNTENDEGSISPLFNDPNADMKFKSCDGVIFRMFKEHLKTSTAGFPSTDLLQVDTQNSIALSEPSKVLLILFGFMRPPSEDHQYHQPYLIDLQPNLFFEIAEAAEKYIVFAAMSNCLSRMHYELSEKCPFDTLQHATKHGYADLANKSAYSALTFPLRSAMKSLSPDIFTRFLTYRLYWEDLKESTIKRLTDYEKNLYGEDSCQRGIKWFTTYVKAVSSNIRKAEESPEIDYSIKCPNRGPGHICICDNLPTDRIKQGKSRAPKFNDISA